LFWLLIAVCVGVLVMDLLKPGVLTVLSAAIIGYVLADAIAWRHFRKELTKLITFVKGWHP
jgi:hypothetical protein